MKKKILIALMSLGVMFNTCAFTGYANDGITVTLNGDKIEFDVQPQLIDDRTMVPLRKIFEAMGAVVDWNDNTQTVTASKDDKVVTAKINDKNLYINGVVKTLDVPPMIVDGRTLVPARFVAESFGANVDWVDSTQTVVISSKWTEGQSIPYYSKYPTIPDLGAIYGISGVEESADSSGASYKYDLKDIPSLMPYVSAMEKAGFQVEVGISDDLMYTGEKNDTYIDVWLFDGSIKVVITLPENQTTINVPVVDGFELAEFSKYNSLASENGLDGTKIYFRGTIESIDVLKLDAPGDMIIGIIRDSNNNKWLCSLNSTLFVDKKEYESLIGEQLMIYGVYQGYSSSYNMPAFKLYKLLSIASNETRDGIAVWTD